MRHLLMLASALFVLAGCETVGGFGQDVENTGEALQRSAQETERDLQ